MAGVEEHSQVLPKEAVAGTRAARPACVWGSRWRVTWTQGRRGHAGGDGQQFGSLRGNQQTQSHGITSLPLAASPAEGASQVLEGPPFQRKGAPVGHRHCPENERVTHFKS